VTVLCLGGPLAGPSAAFGATHHCRQGYVRKTVKVQRHGREIRVERCVRRPTRRPSAQGKSPAAPAAPNAASPVLGVHIDTALSRLPYQPLRATVNVSASASVSPLPEGSIDLFVDGVGECVVPVGATTSGGECLVGFSGLGENKLEAIYALADQSPTREVREAVTIDLGPLAVSTGTAVEDEAFPSPHEECEAALIEAHECDRLLLGKITVLASRTPANAEGGDWLTVEAPVCESWDGHASCGTRWPGGPSLHEGWGRLVFYEWAEGERRGLVVDPSLPRETKAEHAGAVGPAWVTIEGGALNSEASYEARTKFVTDLTGYAASESATPLTLLP